MKAGAAVGVGAVCAAVAALVVYRLPSHSSVSSAPAQPPLETPPGITLQLRADGVGAPPTAQLDVYYADAHGMTLYTFAKDSVRGVSTCRDECAKLWPAALAPPGTVATAGWSLIPRADGTRQWVHLGAPLYRYAHDESIGETKGDGLDNGAWRALQFRPAGILALPDGVSAREVADAGGAALVDAQGMTLYRYAGDRRHPGVGCDAGADCARRWIPLEAPAITRAVGDFSLAPRDDGITQWAYRGELLFLFDGDQKPGDANGIDADPRFQVAFVLRDFMPADATIERTEALGRILGLRSGATLYQRDRATPDEGHDFRADHGPPALGRALGTGSCDARCLRSWRPYAAPPDAFPSGNWDTTMRPDGSRQWVYKGFALYTYALEKPHEISGNETYDLTEVNGTEKVIAVDQYVTAGGAAAGIGVGALFWHAVVP
jgi:predicted lipoprotein with Yx(FWY)xxD motif